MLVLLTTLLAPAFAADADCQLSPDSIVCEGETTTAVSVLQASSEALLGAETTDEGGIRFLVDLEAAADGGLWLGVDGASQSSELAVNIDQSHLSGDTISVNINQSHHGGGEISVNINQSHHGGGEASVNIDQNHHTGGEVSVNINQSHYGTGELEVQIDHNHLVVELDAEGALTGLALGD